MKKFAFFDFRLSAFGLPEGVPPWVWLVLAVLLVSLITVLAVLIIKKNKKAGAYVEARDEAPIVPEVAELDVKTEFSDEQPTDIAVTESVEIPVASNKTVTPIAPVKPSEDVAGESAAEKVIDGEVVPVRYRSSFMSRYIQSDQDIQTYYGILKNTLLSYKGVRSRVSWSCESFNKTRVQCAKINIKGRSLTLNLALDPKDYIDSKYHFTDMSEKPKLEQVPMMIKVRSDRALKYALELITEMMAKLEIDFVRQQNEDYSMPYESTEELVKRELVKVILPRGMKLDDNANIVRADVSEVLENARADEPTSEITGVSLNVVHVDASRADMLVTDDEARARIEFVGLAKKVGGKICEVNLDTVCECFADGETVTLGELKVRGLISKSAGRVKVLARGIMNKRLTVIADKFSLQAVKMITLAGGHAEQIK